LKKLVLYGDGFLCPPGGYGESLIDLLVMRRPEAAFTASLPGEENLTLEASARDLPLLVGKAPDFMYLGLGAGDMLRGADPADAFAALESLVQVLLQKTRARIAVANLCEAFLPPDARAAAVEFNFALPGILGERVQITDLNAPVNIFFDRHRRGSGEKRSLYEGARDGVPPRLTSMGRVFLSHAAYGQLGLEELFPDSL
jgi:hypothetical protein